MITGFSLFLGILFNYLFFEKVPGISFLVFILFAIGGLILILKFSGRSLNREALWLMAPLFFFGAMPAARASPELMLLNIAASLGLLLLFAEVSFGPGLPGVFFSFLFFFCFFPRPILCLKNILQTSYQLK